MTYHGNVQIYGHMKESKIMTILLFSDHIPFQVTGRVIVLNTITEYSTGKGKLLSSINISTAGDGGSCSNTAKRHSRPNVPTFALR